SANYDPAVMPLLYEHLDISFASVLFDKVGGKTKKIYELQKCNYTHFFNLVNATYDLLGLENYYCPDRLDNFNVSGIYTDDYFQYYEFTVQLKKSSLGKLEAVRKIFTDYEIKAEVYYMD